MLKGIKPKDLEKILLNKNLRQHLAYEDPLWFSLIYLKHCFSYPLAPFHLEMFHLLKEPKYEFVVVMAFRESGKSTIMNTANVLWSILGKTQKKFVVIVSQTQDQAKNHFTNIKEELLYNKLLREDFGPFAEDEATWQKMSLELEYNNAKILSVSREQSIRGIKYNSIRPDLIICDDIEDISAAQEESSRHETLCRFSSEILPLGSGGTRIFVLGNLICNESLLMQLRRGITNGSITGIFRAYPIIDDDRRILWLDKYKEIENIHNLSKRFPDTVWVREFLLKSLSANGRELINPIVFDEVFRERYGGSKMELPPQQTPLIPQMEEFKISVPYDQPPIFLFMSDSLEYKLYFGNVYLNEPVMTLREREKMIREKEKEKETP